MEFLIMTYKEFLHKFIISDDLRTFNVTSVNLKTVYIKLLIGKGIVRFTFKNKKNNEIFNKSGKHLIYVLKLVSG